MSIQYKSEIESVWQPVASCFHFQNFEVGRFELGAQQTWATTVDKTPISSKVLFLAMFFISSAIFSGVSKQYFKKFGSSKDVNKCLLVVRPNKG